MGRRKSNTAILSMAILLVALSLVMTVGTAWGRYRTEISDKLNFQQKEISSIYLSGGDTQLPGTWALTSGGGELPFTVANGTSAEDVASQDLTFAVRVAAKEGVGDKFSLSLRLDDKTIYEGKASEIKPNSTMYKEFGPGWIYRFYDEEGVEFTSVLKGGELSKLSATLVCTGTVKDSDTSLLQIMVTAVND